MFCSGIHNFGCFAFHKFILLLDLFFLVFLMCAVSQCRLRFVYSVLLCGLSITCLVFIVWTGAFVMYSAFQVFIVRTTLFSKCSPINFSGVHYAGHFDFLVIIMRNIVQFDQPYPTAAFDVFIQNFSNTMFAY